MEVEELGRRNIYRQLSRQLDITGHFQLPRGAFDLEK